MSCLPVLVLGMGTALAHMLREDAAAADQPDGRSGGPADARSPGRSAEDQPAAVRIELRRGTTAITVNWPCAAALECAAWMRELLR